MSMTGATAARNGAGPRLVEKITKRDNTEEAFDREKIVRAVYRCCKNSTRATEEESRRVAAEVATAVCNLLRHHDGPVHIEDVQRLVIQQLWAAGHFEAAEQYTLYREQRRLARLQRPIPEAFAAQVAADQAHFPTDLQFYQFIGKFSRWREADQRRETWRETKDRAMNWFRHLPRVAGRLTDREWADLDQGLYDLEVSPAMRVLQMAGPALERCEIGAYNCAATPVDDLFCLPELLYILMQGSGCSFSVESDYVAELPRIKKQKGLQPEVIVVEDDTEGWCDAYYEGLQRLFDGHDVWYDTDRVRRAGVRLKTKGGRSGGPGPFLELTAFARNLILSKQGRFLEDVDVHDLACMTGKIVQVGGVRRASCLSHSELLSSAMRHCKSGNWYDAHKYRTMANNSAVYDFDGPPPIELFMEEWLALVKSKSGERGVFNRRATVNGKPDRRAASRFLINPCAEIVLRPRELCNLSMTIARGNDTVDSLRRKVRLAAYFGTMQATCDRFRYVRPEWKKNAEEERLLGVDITGHADCPLLRYGAPGRAELLRLLKQDVAAVNVDLARRFGINRSAADTCVNPGGDSSVFFNCASGVSPRFSDFWLRWVRESVHSPLATFLKEQGVPYAEAPEDKSLYVFGFPMAAPPGSTKRNDLTAAQQFYNWLEWKTEWAEHSVSATIYVEDHEWLELGHLVYKHFDQVVGLAFLPKDNGRYTYAPNEELTKVQYDEFVAKFPKLNWSKLMQFESEDMTEAAQTFACGGGVCTNL